MDASGLLAIFQRSVDNYSVRYTEFLGDGDSKAHRLIVEEAVYGNKEVTKLECVGHVQKRLGSRLRSLKTRLGQTHLDDGKSIGGTGRLTKRHLTNFRFTMGMLSETTLMTFERCKMLSWPFGIIPSQQMTAQTMTCVPLERIPGVAIRGI